MSSRKSESVYANLPCGRARRRLYNGQAMIAYIGWQYRRWQAASCAKSSRGLEPFRVGSGGLYHYFENSVAQQQNKLISLPHPLIKMLRNKRVVIKMGISDIHAINFFHLPRR